ncbi:hypothetical protein FS749_003559 [Ceratobasidium sp. UAMH 11750]|nr:hypothetical protein FS749_003559 [Ceratobasidium sp. UAMH 11750]
MTCPLHRGKLALPSVSLDDQGKRCLDASRSAANNDSQQDPRFSVRYTHGGSPYYTYLNRYLTTNNILNPAIRAMFLRLVTSIEQCASNDTPESGEHEVVIILRCLSERRPKFSYYIVDHDTKSIRWAHGRRFNDSPDLYDVNMRNVAEYWDHRSRFCAHRQCSQGDYDELLELLNRLPTHGQDAVFSADNIIDLRERLTQRVQDPTTTDGTFAISDLHASVLKEQLRGFYEPNLSLKCKLMKSFHGLMQPPRFLHRRAHSTANPAADGAPNPNPTPETQTSHPTTHNNSPSSSRRTTPQSSTDSRST